MHPSYPLHVLLGFTRQSVLQRVQDVPLGLNARPVGSVLHSLVRLDTIQMQKAEVPVSSAQLDHPVQTLAVHLLCV